MRYLVLFFLCLIAVIAYIQRTGINSADTPIQREFQIDTEQFGTIGFAWLVGYALLQMPAGWLADRWGSRNTLTFYAVLWSLITGAIGLCPDYETLVVLWFVMGMALAGVFPCAAKSIGAWFPDTQKAMAAGLLGSSTMLGNAAASGLTSWLLYREGWSWQGTYLLYGILGLVWAGLYFLAIPERTGVSSSVPEMTGDDWRRLFSSGPMWFLCGQQFFRAGAMIFFINWFPKFLKDSRGFNDYDAGLFAMGVNLSALAGGVLGGFFSDWLLSVTGWRRLSRQGISVIGMSTCCVLMLTTYFIEDKNAAVVVFSIGAFIATFGGVSGYTVAIEFGGRRIGVVFSMMNMAGNLAAAIVHLAAGVLAQRTQSWNAAVFLIAGVFAIDALCWALLNPREPLFPEETV
ncbi:MAG: MFS transporter [Planctomycetes bacterium]|nr:MFS transporter [Planctomycetota bacterium]